MFDINYKQRQIDNIEHKPFFDIRFGNTGPVMCSQKKVYPQEIRVRIIFLGPP